jgi:hypothetical protein
MSCVVSRSVIVEYLLLLRPRASPHSVSSNDELLCLIYALLLFAHTFSNHITARLLCSLYHRDIAHPLHSHHIIEHVLLFRLVRLCTAPAPSLTASVRASLTSHSHRSHYTPPALPFRSSLSSHTSFSCLQRTARVSHHRSRGEQRSTRPCRPGGLHPTHCSASRCIARQRRPFNTTST